MWVVFSLQPQGLLWSAAAFDPASATRYQLVIGVANANGSSQKMPSNQACFLPTTLLSGDQGQQSGWAGKVV